MTAALDVPLAGKERPAKSGPMVAPWDPQLLALLNQLKVEVCRAQDSVQVGGPIPRSCVHLLAEVLLHPRAGVLDQLEEIVDLPESKVRRSIDEGRGYARAVRDVRQVLARKV